MAAPSSPPSDSPSPSPSPDGEPAPEHTSRAGVTMMCAAALLVLAMSLIGGRDKDTSADNDPRPAPAATSASPTATTASPSASPSRKSLPRSRPVRLLIPKISVDAPFTTLSLGSNGHLEPPPAADTNLVGWFSGGPAPGELGTAIVAGHVDTKTSAAVFANLRELEKGDTFRITRADGRTAIFVVDSAETFDKDHFPDDRVYGDSPDAQIRLITCAGDYDHAVKDYTENLVVFGHLT